MGMMIGTYGYGPGPQSASVAIAAKEVGGLFVSASSSGVLALFDGSSASGAALVAQFTAVAGTYYQTPFRLNSGNLFVQLVSGTATFTAAVG